MPTGYTADVIDGKITNASDFAMMCARAFGAFIHQRDDSMRATLRYPERHDSYYADELPKRMVELARWDKLTEEEKYAEWSEYATEQEQRAKEAKATAELNMKRLAKVMYEVKSIPVPDSHAEFKKFMIEQLQDTMNFDGRYNENWYRVIPYVEWVESHRQGILRSMEIATEGLHKAEERYQEARRWISTLAQTYGLEIQE